MASRARTGLAALFIVVCVEAIAVRGQPPRILILDHARVIDGTGEAAQNDMRVTIRGGVNTINQHFWRHPAGPVAGQPTGARALPWGSTGPRAARPRRPSRATREPAAALIHRIPTNS